MKKIIVIPAAGRGSRLGIELPKIFTPIFEEKSVYDFIMQHDHNEVDQIILLLSPAGKEFFDQHYKINAPKNLDIWIQPQANGMFEAMNLLFERLLQQENDFQLVLQWGDQPFCDQELQQILFEDLNHHAVSVPLVWVEKPYVQFRLGDRIEVIETREGEISDLFGFKDMGIFAFNRHVIETCWETYKNKAPMGQITHERNFVKFFETIQTHFAIHWRLDQPYYKSIGINTPTELKEANLLMSQIQFARKQNIFTL